MLLFYIKYYASLATAQPIRTFDIMRFGGLHCFGNDFSTFCSLASDLFVTKEQVDVFSFVPVSAKQRIIYYFESDIIFSIKYNL